MEHGARRSGRTLKYSGSSGGRGDLDEILGSYVDRLQTPGPLNPGDGEVGEGGQGRRGKTLSGSTRAPSWPLEAKATHSKRLLHYPLLAKGKESGSEERGKAQVLDTKL